jgi:excisionase family DNA binding protein
MTEPIKLAMKVKDAAAALGVGRDLIYKAIKSGEIKTSRLGDTILVPVQELEKLLGIEAPAPPSNIQVVEAVCAVLGVDINELRATAVAS